MAIKIHRLTNANIYVEGNSILGQASEMELPTIKNKMAEHKALGMFGEFEVPNGIEKMDGKIKWNSFYKDVLKQMANPYKNLSIQVRGNLEKFNAGGRSEQVPVVAALTIAARSLPGGSFKQNENVEAETEYTAYYFKLTIEGEDIVEVDVLENIYKAGGVDLLQQYRTNIGG